MMMVSDHVDANGKPLGTLGHGEMWSHTDKCYHRRPHRATFLYGIEIPSEGGHTKFSSLYAAYDRMPADLKRRLSKLRQEAQKAAATHRGFSLSVEAEGAGQIVMVGPPNVGKSALLGVLTKATPEVADYPFTTRRPMPGMMLFENVQIQLVDMPPLSQEYMESWMSQIVRNADAIDLNSRTLNVEVDIDNRAGRFKPGAYVFVHLKLPDNSVRAAHSLVIPADTLLFRAEGLQVGVVRGDHAELARITIGRDYGSTVEVVNGLRPTDQVIVNPSDSLTTGSAVRLVSHKQAGVA